MSHQYESFNDKIYLEFESLTEKAWEDACETDDASTESVITGVHFIGEFFIGKNLRKIL